MKYKSNMDKGVITTLVLVFGFIFLLLLGGLLSFILFQLKLSAQKVAFAESLNIAESGIHYYRWYLNNNLTSLCDEEPAKCQSTPYGPFEMEYFDPAANLLGTFSLEVTPSIVCDETLATIIDSTGWTKNFPEIKREVKVLYAKASVGKYAYLINNNVWAGADREIRGLYHSNGGIRMDGENQSLVSSAQEEWICTDSFGCSSCPVSDGCRIDGTDCICPGVFTTTSNSDPNLFDFPVPNFDFEGITIDLAEIKSITQPYPQERYWPSSTDIDANGKGYHLKFQNTGSFEVWIITELSSSYAYSIEEGWHDDYFIINNEYLYNTVSIDSGCPLIFLEDNLWVEGEVKGKVTVASANLVDPLEDTDVVLPGEINYTTLDGSDGFAVIGERNVLISPNSPDIMELRGIFVAQKGRFGRNHYPDNIKEKLEIYGSIVSNGRVGTKWTSGGQVVSGYLKRENYFDQNLVYTPPPFVPNVSPDVEIVRWEEVE